MSHIRPILDQQLEKLLEVAKEHAERIRVYKETYDGIVENIVRVAYEPPSLVAEPVDELTALQKTVTDAIMAMNLEDLTIVATTLGIINKGDAFLAATYCAATPSDPTSSAATSQKAPTPTAGSSLGSITVSPKPVTSNANGKSSGSRKRCSTSTSST